MRAVIMSISSSHNEIEAAGINQVISFPPPNDLRARSYQQPGDVSDTKKHINL